MDGFDPSTNVVVIAATNRADVLDSALTRPGRFDRQIFVGVPDIAGRKEIFAIHLKNITLDGPVDQYSSRLAALTPGFTGADIANIWYVRVYILISLYIYINNILSCSTLCLFFIYSNEAAIIAVRRDKNKVDILDFESATDRVIGGIESKKIMTLEERRIIGTYTCL
jgi:AFG3 family protein